ncbi:MAG: hypothetical protein AAF223_06590, partial [Bacteroidota bacterium]
MRILALVLMMSMPGVVQPLRAQSSIPIETWRTHFSYHNSQLLEVTSERIYVAAQHGLFSLSRADNSLQILSKNDGLSDVGVTAMHYNANLGLILAYQSGVVDVTAEGQVYPFTLLRDEANGDEIVYDILVQGNEAYLATSAGVRVLSLDLERDDPWQIRESYVRLGETGETITVFQLAIVGDSLFLATEAGVIANALDPLVNRQDFNTWRRFDIVAGEETTRYFAQIDNEFFVAVDQQGIYRFQNGQWLSTSFSTETEFNGLSASANG